MGHTIIPAPAQWTLKYSRDETEVEAENAAVIAVVVPDNVHEQNMPTIVAVLGDGRRVVLDEDAWIESDTSIITAEMPLEDLVG